MNKRVATLCRLLISLGLLGGLFWVMRDSLSAVWGYISEADIFYTGIAFIFLSTMVFFLSVRLREIFQGEVLNITLTEAFKLTCLGYLFNNFMPTSVGGDVIKAHYATKFHDKRIKCYASVFMDRFIGMASILLMACVALLLDRGRFAIPVLRPVMAAIILLGAVLIGAAVNRTVARALSGLFTRLKLFGIGEKLNEVYSIVHDYRNRPRIVFRALSFSLLAQISFYSMIYFFFRAMRAPVLIADVFMIMPVVTFISLLPSLGGLGIREYGIVTFFSAVASKEVSFAVSLLALSGYFLISFMGVIVYGAWELFPRTGRSD